jgi:hypothetical protein
LSNTTATAASGRGGGEIPYSQILEGYNQLCEVTNLRPIRSITGKRKTQTATQFKEYGLSGFFNAFEKVAASVCVVQLKNRPIYDHMTIKKPAMVFLSYQENRPSLERSGRFFI